MNSSVVRVIITLSLSDGKKASRYWATRIPKSKAKSFSLSPAMTDKVPESKSPCPGTRTTIAGPFGTTVTLCSSWHHLFGSVTPGGRYVRFTVTSPGETPFKRKKPCEDEPIISAEFWPTIDQPIVPPAGLAFALKTTVLPTANSSGPIMLALQQFP